MFERNNGIIIACDVETIEELRSLVEIARDSSVVVGYKVGFSLALRFGLPTVVTEVKDLTAAPVIYDHQKAGTDIPQMGQPFAACCADSGVDGVIVFPQAGPETMRSFLQAIGERGMTPIVGGVMTHPKYLQSDGGYLADTAPESIYATGLELGVSHFVLPGNKPEMMQRYAAGVFAAAHTVSLLMPGIGRQGGKVAEAFRAARPHRSYAIVGTTIYGAADPQSALADFGGQIEECEHGSA